MLVSSYLQFSLGLYLRSVPFDKKARKRAESAKKQTDEDGRNYGKSPRRYYYAGSDDGPPPRKLDLLNDEEGYRAGITYDLHSHRGP